MMYSFKHLIKLLSFIFILLIPLKTIGQTGTASWYGPGFHGKKTASGQRYNQHGMTAAHKTLKLGTKVRVTNLHNNMSVIVVINDRGPFVRGRIIDLSHKAKTKLAMNGTTKVSVEVVE